MSGKLEASKNNGPHRQLARLEGTWQGTAKTWFEPGKLADESPVTATMKLILDGRFILHEYKGSMQGKPLEGMAIYGYHLDLQKFQVAWIDSFHNGSAIMFSEGRKGTDELNVSGSYAYVTPEAEQYWGWRTQIDINDDDTVTITAYNVSPTEEEAKATEVVLTRLK